MKALFTALYNKFKATPANSFYTGLSGKLYPYEAPQGTVVPFATYSAPSNVTARTFTATQERVLIEISIYAGTHTSACDLFEYCKALFDDCQLSVTGYRAARMEREFAHEIKEEFYYRWIVEYGVWLEKT